MGFDLLKRYKSIVEEESTKILLLCLLGRFITPVNTVIGVAKMRNVWGFSRVLISKTKSHFSVSLQTIARKFACADVPAISHCASSGQAPEGVLTQAMAALSSYSK